VYNNGPRELREGTHRAGTTGWGKQKNNWRDEGTEEGDQAVPGKKVVSNWRRGEGKRSGNSIRRTRLRAKGVFATGTASRSKIGQIEGKGNVPWGNDAVIHAGGRG